MIRRRKRMMMIKVVDQLIRIVGVSTTNENVRFNAQYANNFINVEFVMMMLHIQMNQIIKKHIELIDIKFKTLDATIAKLFNNHSRIVQIVILNLLDIFVKFVICLMMITKRRKFGIVTNVSYVGIQIRRISFIVMVANVV